MKFLLAALNAKYIHSNLAVYDLQAYASDYADHIVLKEYTINQQKDDIMRDIYMEHPDVVCVSCYIWNLSFVKELMADKMDDAVIVETNTYYEGDRYTTEQHRETLKVNGWTFCPVDIMDKDGTAMLPVKNGKWFTEMSVGRNLLNYESLLVLTHFKGHVMGGFGGSNKNIGIGCADGRIGKAMIHTVEGSDNMWSIAEEELMERITESTKSVVDHFGEHIAFINVMRNMSLSCDCEGVAALPVVTPDVGIVASLDILAADQVCVDMIYAMKENDHKDLIERMESRHSLRQLSYMKEMTSIRFFSRVVSCSERESFLC